ncbi:MAG: DEAD/DEAH box helicase [Thaumarchaeota archaeon]|nr:DEAD/DEAH box helicase [Nitrososphaerota archaeon]
MNRPAGDPGAPPRPDGAGDAIGGDAPDAIRDAVSSKSVRLVRHVKRARRDFAAGPPVDAVGLHDKVVGRLKRRIRTLHAYQAEAIGRILARESVAIEAPTAAGKTVAFLAPVMHIVAGARGAGTRALLVYPTNALMRDQFQEVSEIAKDLGKRAAIMNAGTGVAERKRMVADPPEVILTTFDMLHGQMAGHGPLSEILGTVEILVVDEAHYYSGLLGSNVHHVVARLKRLCGGLQCIAVSATLRGSGGFCSGLFGQGVHVVREEGRLADMDFAMLAPAVPAERRDDARLLRHRMMVDIARRVTGPNSKTLLFSNSRRGAEIVGVMARDAGLRAGIHRGGMGRETPRIERDFREGRLDALSCTPTLELGIDIGDVGTVISEFVPVNRLAQRAGRAGRRGRRGLAVLALGNDPISQYYRGHPEDYDLDEWEPHMDPANRRVGDIQTVAMAADRPLGQGELAAREEAVERGIAGGLLAWRGGAIVATGAGRQAATGHKIRGIGEAVRVFCGGEEIGDRNLPYAIGELHQGALYLHNGSTYRIERLDLRRRRAEASLLPPETRMHTIPLVEKEVRPKRALDTRGDFGDEVRYCEIEVALWVKKYIERDYRTAGGRAETKRLESGVRYSFVTNAVEFWAPRPEVAMRGADPGDEEGAYHAIEHVMVEASRMVIGVTHSDMDSKSCANGMVYVYDRIDGGNGASRALHARMDGVVSRAAGILGGCACRDDKRGCVHCTFAHMCGRENEVLHKVGALESLQRLAGTFGG